MKRLQTIEEQVKGALVSDPSTRGDDFLLVLEVYKNYLPLDLWEKLSEVLSTHNKHSLPSFASVVRSRRKLQAEDVSLVNTKVKSFRKDQEQAYLDYVRN